MFHDLKSVLARSLRQKGLSRAVEAAQVVDVFRSLVGEMFGPEAAAGLRQVALRGDILEVGAGNSALASELTMRQSEITRALSDKMLGNYYRLKIFG